MPWEEVGPPPVLPFLLISLAPLPALFRGVICVCVFAFAFFSQGLFVGKEGPAVHIASALAGNLMKLRLFRKIGKRHDLYMQVISAACAAGIAANFGSIVGGILFSAEEVTATYYLVTNFWKGMFAALTGAIMFFGIRGIISSQVTHLFSTNYGPIPYSFSELVLFALLGILCGLLGAGWNGCLRWLFKMKKKYKFLGNARYSTIMIMCIITGFITFLPGHFMRINPNETIDELLSSKPLRNYGQSLIFIPLIFSALVKVFFLSCLLFSLSLCVCASDGKALFPSPPLNTTKQFIVLFSGALISPSLISHLSSLSPLLPFFPSLHSFSSLPSPSRCPCRRVSSRPTF